MWIKIIKIYKDAAEDTLSSADKPQHCRMGLFFFFHLSENVFPFYFMLNVLQTKHIFPNLGTPYHVDNTLMDTLKYVFHGKIMQSSDFLSTFFHYSQPRCSEVYDVSDLRSVPKLLH